MAIRDRELVSLKEVRVRGRFRMEGWKEERRGECCWQQEQITMK
jgi:hypothetical protein